MFQENEFFSTRAILELQDILRALPEKTEVVLEETAHCAAYVTHFFEAACGNSAAVASYKGLDENTATD